ncbi:MAG: RNA-processing protein [Thermoplasmata archaeon HGW-Thermoplasmata-1]|nr:MAG: RNA-processing protein [Thermoplasmata archaeon HGW-Thermoplasmata-1]
MRITRIPRERVGALIGPDGKTRKYIEKRSGVGLSIDSESGEVIIVDEKADPLMGLKVDNVVRAIGRGFSPERAFKLFNDDYYFIIFDINDYVSGKKDHVRRVKARIIGSEGKTRTIIEQMTGATLCIYGHTVCVIVDLNAMEVTKTAIDMLLSGSEHATVYKFLERKQMELKMARYGF